MRLRPTLVTPVDVLAKCDFFVDTQIWPLKQNLNPEGWLRNFTEAEKPFAAMLLNAFLYLSDGVVNSIFESTIQYLISTMNRRAHQETPIYTFIEGETSSLTDSGRVFARKLRDLLSISQDNILEPTQALALHCGTGRPVVFVDDFVGTGVQCLDTWEAVRLMPDGQQRSFKSVAQSSMTREAAFIYSPVVCTTLGKLNIEAHSPELLLHPGHFVADEYSALSEDSIVWPEEQKVTGPTMLRKMSLRAGIPDDLNNRRDWRGFAELGLCLGFSYGPPDATLPIFSWEENGWIPLIRKP